MHEDHFVIVAHTFTNTSDYIFVYDLLSDELCDKVIARLDKRNKWRGHQWFNAGSTDYTENQDFLTSKDERCKNWIVPKLAELSEAYHQKYYDDRNTNSDIFWNVVTNVKFNKYREGESIRSHHDHIHDMFDGSLKGIPVSSVIGLLNDNFEGGDLVFWDEYHVPLKKGQVAIFPSCFVYPHQVTEVTSGTRYSWVTWCV